MVAAMGRTFVAGAFSITKDRLSAAMRAPFLGLLYANLLGQTRERVRSIKDLKPTTTRYDEARGLCFFELELHDDDLPNASFEPLLQFLATVPSVPGEVFIAGRDDWQATASWYALVLDGEAQELPYLEPAKAAELVTRLAWPPATDVLALLEA
jgi:hypothetical protein